MNLKNLSKKFNQARREKKIIKKIGRRDKDAFVEAYDLYVDQIYRFVFFKISSSEDAEDLTSAIFLKTWNYIQEKGLEDPKTFKALIYKIARNTIIDHYRKGKINQISLDNEIKKIDLPDEKINLEKDFDRKLASQKLQKHLKELKDEYREVVVMRYIEELSVKEIADIVDKSKGNVRVLLHRALKALQDIINNSNDKN